jgi:hypothetical protein
MREMLDAAEEIWLNIFWLNTWSVAWLDAIPGERTSVAP